ncbi:c-type cytochrome [Pseudoduganella sp. GCM10020061]|uniref:c-type cytochrome n=1 Tax=Pseudoduganella sp. GCM10020061 TaxID=3317345 RepID=UPI00362989F3
MRGYFGSRQDTGKGAFTLALACAIGLPLVLLAGCRDEIAPLRVPGGDAARGKALVSQYQCGACHAIPGVAAASGTAGPPLDAFGRRSYIAGHIPNQPANLVRWLIDPPAMAPGTTMPSLGLSEDEARHMAAYLYSLE